MDTREVVTSARRVVVKVGSSSLTHSSGGLDSVALDKLVDALAACASSGAEVVLVSSGAIAAGLTALGLSSRPRHLAGLQAAAAVGQARLVQSYSESFSRFGLSVAQVLLTENDVASRVQYRNARSTLHALLEMGVVPVVNENDTVATEEIRFGDNDRLSALVAHLVGADLLVLLSDVDGVYDRDPRLGGARMVSEVRSGLDLAGVSLAGTGSGVGTGGMATKVGAAQMAASEGVAVVLTSSANASSALRGAPVGTLFYPSGERGSSRKLWIRHATRPRGRLFLDEGALRAVTSKNASLLAAGITHTSGAFAAGDPVELVDPAGRVVARGLVGYDAEVLEPLLGRTSSQIEATGLSGREVVHRDDLVLLGSE